jgi:hypothetical protein
MTQRPGERERSTAKPTPPATDLPAPLADLGQADALPDRFYKYLVQMVEELTGWHLWMSSNGMVYANRIGPVTDIESAEGAKRTLQGYGDPAVLIKAIHEQALIAQRIAMRDATRI